ncbi:hypothetical protein EA473_19405 [Natrarchaeobius chitinivorans]|uniref:Uncharacterized protein n=2 Tax=Natrarchaeobius chitinivorans TaxID=1679083 RepID=A0A3N6M6Q2_NATCH|nr:hypothetical protein EA473_19405 [Natrarchaeobius chitinivorans]
MLSTPNPDPPAHTTARHLASTVSESIMSPLRASAFWATIALPLLALVLLVAGVVSISLLTTAGFLAAYGACAIAGHNHTPN